MEYKHKYVTGSTYAFYNNSDELDDSANFSSWSLDLLHSDSYTTAIADIAPLTKDIISGSDYRWYADDFVFPQVDTGCYVLAVIDTADSNEVVYLSDPIDVVNNAGGLKYVSFRNGKNILNYNYEVLTSFRNKFHVETLIRKPLMPVVSEGYDLSNGSFYRVRTILTKTYEFVTGWFDENEHDATQAMTIHNDIKTEIKGLLKSVSLPDDSEYLLEWQENYEAIQASFRLEVTDRSSSNEAS
jgi:hypothetical protein